jgi:hypothetical protein
MVWTGFVWLRIGTSAVVCESNNELLGFMKDERFLYQLNDYQLIYKDSARLINIEMEVIMQKLVYTHKNMIH